ncbi:MAG: sigma-70 family RNA polymerase sigma factor [Polyangiaceae bacterium]|nr:sigma-70 family RNA polymerase sigma factor [Polyangiaceae bacterium]
MVSPSLSSSTPPPDDAVLLRRVAQRARDGAAARRAEAELYERHVRYLYGVLMSRSSRLLAHAGIGAEDLVQETFHRAFERAHTFDRDGIDDPERMRLRTRAWLGRIAQNLLADQLSRQREVSASPYLERVSCDDIDEAPSSTDEVRALRRGLAQLSEREQDVLRVTALYQRVGEPHQRLPNEVSAELATRWGITSDNIRAIRKRALQKLKAFVVADGAAPEEES